MSQAGTAINPEAVPRVCEVESGLESINLTPEEGFVLSRVDGTSSVEILCRTTGLGEEKTLKILAALKEKGLLTFREQCIVEEEEVEEETPAAALAGPAPEYDLKTLKAMLKEPLPRNDQAIPIVESIFVNLENLSYYDLLGIGRDAEPKEIKKAYFRATKSFHPDRFYRRADRDFRRKLQEIFKQVNKGYRILSNPESKKQYDESLGPEEEEEIVAPKVSAPPGARTRAVKGEASPWKKVRVARQKPIEERIREPAKKEADSKKPKLKLGLKEGGSPKSPLLKKIQKLKKEKGAEVFTKAEKFYTDAMIEKERGNINAAKINLQLALQFAPGHEKYKKALEELKEAEDIVKAQTEFRAGLDAQADGDLKTAKLHYHKAMSMGYENPKLFHRLADLLMELDKNYEAARALLLKAIEKEEGVPDYHLSLARAYRGMGQKAAAIAQLEKVVKLDPKNKLAAKELKALKRG